MLTQTQFIVSLRRDSWTSAWLSRDQSPNPAFLLSLLACVAPLRAVLVSTHCRCCAGDEVPTPHLVTLGAVN